MLRLSWSTFTERWPLFVGAALTVCLGVALVQSSLLVLISVATLDAPAGLSTTELAGFAESVEVGVTLSALTLAFSAFLTVFIVGSTFAFTVAQRRRDLALLRLAGGGRGQLRRLLLSEAVLLGGIGTAAGVPVGLAVMAFQSWLLGALGFVPPGFTPQWRTWILGVSVGVGLAVAVAGVLVAARRASRVQPLEALRDSGEAARVMTAGRWGAGGLFGAGAVALVVLSPLGGAGGGQAMAVNAALCAAVAFSALSPLLVPGIARLLPAQAGGVLAELAGANLRDGVRRSASIAAPLIVLVGLLLGQTAALTSFATAAAAEQRRGTSGDLVVEATGAAAGPWVSGVPGVAATSTELTVPISVTRGTGEDAETERGAALVVDPAAYERFHPGTAGLAGLRGRAAAAGPGGDAGSPGETVAVRAGGADLGPLLVVAAAPARIGGGANLLLPAGLVPEHELADAPSRTFVALHPGADGMAVAAAVAAVGEVHTVDEWSARDAAARDAMSTSVLLVIMGLGGVYALIGVINAVVVGASARRPEFAAARAAGLSRGQVVRSALLESWAVTVIGLLLGVLAAGTTFLAVLATTAVVTGAATLAVPWPFVLTVCVGAFLVTGATSVITSMSATRTLPVALLGSRE
ncbi:FtsX-like permease family protein [Pseudonocardia xinjiangensis]|uniref:FtsX-like permease family protein n=1 Tax=Pseudonocardia xinjiangensis TaxID=75289 RepID=A0ABX1RKK5_9PSEU|nr:FtsX-like permease family protein [Pseudonocardia xinjiangensis]NMH80922.1 FtsX-like permease family protein [Pseudonocardia xinjiangensis]